MPCACAERGIVKRATTPAVITECVFMTPSFRAHSFRASGIVRLQYPVKVLSNRAPNVTQLSADRGTAAALVAQVPGMPPRAVGRDLERPSMEWTKGQDATARSLARCEQMIERLAEPVPAHVL